MARAAAKRRQPTHHHRDDRRHKDSGGQRFEDTLFFNRLRKRAKWVFIFLAVVFAGGFVLFGVGSSNVSGLSDIFNGIGGGGSGQPSVSKAEKATQKNPKDAAAWKTLAAAYDTTGDIPSAISAWTTYTTLRPKDVDGLQSLATDYEQQFSTQTQMAAAAQAEAQNAQGDAVRAAPDLTARPGAELGLRSDRAGGEPRRQPALQHGAPDPAGDRTAARGRLRRRSRRCTSPSSRPTSCCSRRRPRTPATRRPRSPRTRPSSSSRRTIRTRPTRASRSRRSARPPRVRLLAARRYRADTRKFGGRD